MGETMRRSLIAAAVVAVAVTAAPALAETPATSGKSKDYGDYQIVRANDTTVWRLNRKTGEMTVCRLVRDAMVCTSSSNAAKAPPRTYEQLEAERKRTDAERKEKQIATMDRFLGIFRELFTTAIDNGGPPKPGETKKSGKQ